MEGARGAAVVGVRVEGDGGGLVGARVVGDSGGLVRLVGGLVLRVGAALGGRVLRWPGGSEGK